jgi:diguanylate cyclase
MIKKELFLLFGIRKTTLKHISTFGSSSYQISDLQLLRNSDDDAAIAKLLANCLIMQLDADEAVTESGRARLYIVVRGALSVATDTRTGMADGTVSKILPGESVGEQSVLDDAANLDAITALETASCW